MPVIQSFRTGAAAAIAFAPPPPSGSLKAPVGFHVLGTGQVGITSGYGLPQIEAEIDAAFFGSSVIQGFQLYVTWAAMQTGAGAYSFTLVDAVRNYIAVNYPTKGFSLVVYHEDYFASPPTRAVPADILAGSVYGPGFDGVHFGYWQGTSGSGPQSLAAFWRSNAIQGMPVVDNLLSFVAAFASHVWAGVGNTGLWTYNTDPLFLSFTPIEESAVTLVGTGAGSDSTLTASSFNTNWQLILAGCCTALNQVTILNGDNWGAGLANGQSNANARVNAAAGANVANGNKQIAFSGPDLFILPSQYTPGQNAYTGLGSGSTNQSANMNWCPRCETGSSLTGEDPGVDATVTLAKLLAVVKGNGGTAIFLQPGSVGGHGYTASQILTFAAANTLP